MPERADAAAAAAERASAPAVAAPEAGPPSPAPASLAAFTALGGPPSEEVVVGLQERAGNRATTQWLARHLDGESSTDLPRGPSTAADFDRAIAARDVTAIVAAGSYGPASPGQRIAMIGLVLDQGWVGPRDEAALERLWDAWGTTGVAAAYAANTALWDACVERGAELADIPSLAAVRMRFEADVKALAHSYMRTNGAAVRAEAERLGVGSLDGPATAATPNVPAIVETQQLAREVQRADDALVQLRSIPVGYEWDTTDLLGGAQRSDRSVATFSPLGPPMQRPGAGEAGFGRWEDIDPHYRAVERARAHLVSLNPALYAVSGERGQAGELARLSPQAAVAQLRDVLARTLVTIRETDAKLDADDLDWRDLVPLHAQLYGGLPAMSGTTWGEALHRQVAEDVIGDHEAAQFWIGLGLASLATAAFIFSELATSGLATFVWAAVGVAAGGTAAAMSVERYEDLATASGAATSDETRLVTDEQVTEAGIAAVLDTAFAFLDGFQAVRGLATAVRATAAREGLGRLGQLSGGEARQAVERAVAELGPQETLRRSGRTAEELVGVVGEQSGAARSLRGAATDVTVGPAAHDPSGAGAAAPTPEGRRLAAAAQPTFERWASLTPEQRLAELAAPVNARLRELGCPPAAFELQDGTDAGGQVLTTEWKVLINGGPLRGAATTTDSFARVVNAVAHEGRHLEQWFRMAQVEAQGGANAAEIAAKVHVPERVADAAIEVEIGFRPGIPLAGSAAEAEARRFLEAVYGDATRNARSQTITELLAAAAEIEDASRQVAAIPRGYPDDDPIRELAQERLQAAWARRDAVVPAYRGLPEEIDAFRVGDAADAAMQERFRQLHAIRRAERVEDELRRRLAPLEDLFVHVADRPHHHVAYDRQVAYAHALGRWKRSLEELDRLQAQLGRLGAGAAR
jgi:hypothetical protein